MVLVFSIPTGSTFYLDTDASKNGIGAVLSQKQGGIERVIAYGSRSLTKAETNYCATRRELLALVYFMRHFRAYLIGRPFVVCTDHAAVQWLQGFKEPEGQVARWLQEFDFSLEHRPGKVIRMQMHFPDSHAVSVAKAMWEYKLKMMLQPKCLQYCSDIGMTPVELQVNSYWLYLRVLSPW